MLKKQLLFILFAIFLSNSYAQFVFSGQVDKSYAGTTAYLSIVPDCHKKNLFITENILLETPVDSLGDFLFTADILKATNAIYKIHIDQCNSDIKDYKHLINDCEDSKEVLFIANNTDSIHFPLNELSQEFCSVETAKNKNNSLFAIQEFHQNLFADLQFAINDTQRKIIYKKHFLALQNFSKTFREPLAELYAYHLYADENTFNRSAYLEDLTTSSYYNDLLNKLKSKYPNTSYTKNFEKALKRDNYPLLEQKTNNHFWWYIVLLLLLFSLALNLYFISQRKPKKVDYKKVLSKQEQKVFSLMPTKSNKEIASLLFISLSTVKTHINTIYAKLNINSRNDIGQLL